LKINIYFKYSASEKRYDAAPRRDMCLLLGKWERFTIEEQNRLIDDEFSLRDDILIALAQKGMVPENWEKIPLEDHIHLLKVLLEIETMNSGTHLIFQTLGIQFAE
jgi:hypothetical protein